MANLIDSLSKNKSLVSESTPKNEKETIKEGPSLFDSLLKESSEDSTLKTESKSISNKEEVKAPTTQKEQVKTENGVENEENIKNSAGSQKTEEPKVEVKSENKTQQSGSLLDRLVIEAKKETESTKNSLVTTPPVKAESTVVVEEVLVNGAEEVKTPTIQNEQVEESKNIVENEESLKNSAEVLETEEPKVEAKSENKTQESNSLLDRLVVEAKKESEVSKIDVSEEVKVSIPVENKDITKKIDESLKVEQPKVEQTIQEDSNLIQTDLSVDELENTTVIGKNVDLVEDEKTNLLQNTVLSTQDNSLDEVKPKEKQSLMDLLILKNSQKNLLVQNEELIKNQPSSSDFISNMYLSSQKNVLNNQLMFNKKEAMSILQEGQTLKDVEKSADLLDLGLENVDVEQTLGSGKKLDIKQQDMDILNRKSILDKLFIEKNIKSDDVKGLITQSIEASKALMDNSLNVQEDVAVNVNSPLSYNIQSRIIGAKQQMSMMMSDIARQMYENYKPPVTVFKINLNPLELGSISILMKNDRNNGLNISMNVSNMTTLDALIENQNVLKSSLNKTFDENTAFNLDFNSSNQGESQSQNNNQTNQEQRFGREQIDTQTVLQLKEENKDREDNLDYM